jgi:hypothetical protein
VFGLILEFRKRDVSKMLVFETMKNPPAKKLRGFMQGG